MGRFTDEMTRLCSEIVACRQARKGFLKNLTHNVATMKANFRRAHQEMARKARAERQAALNRLKKTVGAMRHELAADLEGARRAWAGK
jgi:adenylyl- and sulfurtransferase ThiI